MQRNAKLVRRYHLLRFDDITRAIRVETDPVRVEFLRRLRGFHERQARDAMIDDVEYARQRRRLVLEALRKRRASHLGRAAVSVRCLHDTIYAMIALRKVRRLERFRASKAATIARIFGTNAKNRLTFENAPDIAP
ncbi:hypothetical protein PUR29_35065 [Methylobacterium ajmalii]|uniref:Uncharacterized protein n=1 Tax=Methylobacterium ajmalii TaxID=2738439 RepID=A0ABV0A5V5_9HYPH